MQRADKREGKEGGLVVGGVWWLGASKGLAYRGLTAQTRNVGGGARQRYTHSSERELHNFAWAAATVPRPGQSFIARRIFHSETGSGRSKRSVLRSTAAMRMWPHPFLLSSLAPLFAWIPGFLYQRWYFFVKCRKGVRSKGLRDSP